MTTDRASRTRARIVGDGSRSAGGPGPDVMVAGTLEDHHVLTMDGDDIGKVTNIMLDVRSGRIDTHPHLHGLALLRAEPAQCAGDTAAIVDHPARERLHVRIRRSIERELARLQLRPADDARLVDEFGVDAVGRRVMSASSAVSSAASSAASPGRMTPGATCTDEALAVCAHAGAAASAQPVASMPDTSPRARPAAPVDRHPLRRFPPGRIRISGSAEGSNRPNAAGARIMRGDART